MAVSLATASVPEEHYRRLHITQFVAKSFRAMADQMNLRPHHQGSMTKKARLELQMYKPFSARTLGELFNFLDLDDDGYVSFLDLRYATQCLTAQKQSCACRQGNFHQKLLRVKVWGGYD